MDAPWSSARTPGTSNGRARRTECITWQQLERLWRVSRSALRRPQSRPGLLARTLPASLHCLRLTRQSRETVTRRSTNGTHRRRQSPQSEAARDRPHVHLRDRPVDRAEGLQGPRPRTRREGQGPDRRRGHETPDLHRREPRGRGRPAPRAYPGDQAAVRDRRVPRRAAPPQPARPRPADQDQRAYAEGPEEDRRAREEGEVMAPPRKSAARGRTRRRVKKNVAIGQAHIKTSFNNTIVSLTDTEGNVIAWESAGSAGFKGSRKSTPFAAQVTADNAARKGMEHGLQKVEVFVKGPGSGRETAIRSLQAAGLEILGVKDVSPQAHNGVRQKKRRRV